MIGVWIFEDNLDIHMVFRLYVFYNVLLTDAVEQIVYRNLCTEIRKMSNFISSFTKGIIDI